MEAIHSYRYLIKRSTDWAPHTKTMLYLLVLLSLLWLSNGITIATRRLKSHCTPRLRDSAISRTSLYSSQSNQDDAISRRRKRRSATKDDVKEKIGTKSIEETTSTRIVQQQESSSSSSKSNTMPPKEARNDDGSSNLEDLFGLGNDQLRELLEQELPVPREDLVTRKEISEEELDKNKVFSLPDLGDFMQKTGGKRDSDRKAETKLLKSEKVDRKNKEEYLRALELNPFADADNSIFLDEYDIIPSIFGSGKIVGIPVPFLQTGHLVLGVVVSLAAFIYLPGNPLTEFPREIRTFLKQGLGVTYSINAVLAVFAFLSAKSKNLPPVFWAVKTLLIGGIAIYEIDNARDPDKMNDDDDVTMSKPWDRKSRGRVEQKDKGGGLFGFFNNGDK